MVDQRAFRRGACQRHSWGDRVGSGPLNFGQQVDGSETDVHRLRSERATNYVGSAWISAAYPRHFEEANSLREVGSWATKVVTQNGHPSPRRSG